MPPTFQHIILSQNTTASTSALRLAEQAGVREILGPFPERYERPLKRIPAMRKILRRYRPDLLITYNWGTIEWCLASAFLGGIQHVHQEHGFGPEESDAQLPRRRWARTALLKLVDGLIVPSRLLDQLARSSWNVPGKRLHHVANAIDPAIYHPHKSPLLKDPERPCIIGTAVPLRREKRLDRMISALTRLPPTLPYQVQIFGYGPERPGLERQVEDLELADRVRFMGAVDSTSAILRDLDIFVMSSETEQMPLAILEAMASGLPIVATDVGDIKAMVSTENKPCIVPFGDPDAFARALEALLRNPDMRRQLGEANRLNVNENYHERDMARRLTDIYAQILQRPELQFL